MASLPRLCSPPVEPARKVAPELVKPLPPSGHRSLFDSTIRAPPTVANTVGPRTALSAACTIVKSSKGASPAEPSRAEPCRQRAAVRTLEAEFKTLYDTHL